MKRLFIDLDGTVAKFNVRNALERFDKEKGFFAKLGAYVNIEVINELAKTNKVFVISASPNEQADKDKLVWLSKFLPNVNSANITLCRLGENKAKIIESKYNITINEDCYLLDDYSKNLFEWCACGGKGIKRLTSLADNSRGLWKGWSIKNLIELQDFFA